MNDTSKIGTHPYTQHQELQDTGIYDEADGADRAKTQELIQGSA